VTAVTAATTDCSAGCSAGSSEPDLDPGRHQLNVNQIVVPVRLTARARAGHGRQAILGASRHNDGPQRSIAATFGGNPFPLGRTFI
jgi:hypothetical protein